jgi:hypothetical protein
VPMFYIDGHKVEQNDRFGDGSHWFEMMLLPDRADVAGPFTPVKFARHRAWGQDPKWASRPAVHVPMQDVSDRYNDGFLPQKQCEPAEVIAASARFTPTREFRACVFVY